ncbi:toxin biosynthesis protein [Moniliophthora roreri]|nr:toxin biosynthesis protein [Moniliophthora roreri]
MGVAGGTLRIVDSTRMTGGCRRRNRRSWSRRENRNVSECCGRFWRSEVCSKLMNDAGDEEN